MNFLLCAATEFEIAPTIQFIQQQKLQEKVDVLITNVGLLNATYQLTKRVTFSKPHTILMAGVAGCFDQTIPLTTTTVVLRETIGDMGVLQKGTFTSAFGMGLLKANEHPWQDEKLTNPHTDLLTLPELVFADAVTVNEISTAEERISYYKNGLGATAETMEGAALHYIGLMENIPFLQLRSFCNYVGERDKQKWEMQGAVANVNAVLQEVLVKLLQS